MRHFRVYILSLFIFFFILTSGWIIWHKDFSGSTPMRFGVTFSKPYAEYMGLPWRELYTKQFDDLGVRRVRLIAYWNQIETVRGVYDFTDLDWQVQEALQRGVEIILAVGRRLPRWPECHDPSWLAMLSADEQQKSLLAFVEQTINRYKPIKTITRWQVENEPLLSVFGNCPKPDLDFLQQEIRHVRALDARPIVITDSGELSTWRHSAPLGDYLGTTLYRVVWNSLFGFFHHHFPPALYVLRAHLVEKNAGKVFIAELQAEPWSTATPIQQLSIAEQFRSMNAEQFKKNVEFARRTGFPEAYFWGVEWWYWLKEKQNDSRMWEAAKEVFRE